MQVDLSEKWWNIEINKSQQTNQLVRSNQRPKESKRKGSNHRRDNWKQTSRWSFNATTKSVITCCISARLGGNTNTVVGIKGCLHSDTNTTHQFRQCEKDKRGLAAMWGLEWNESQHTASAAWWNLHSTQLEPVRAGIHWMSPNAALCCVRACSPFVHL